MTRRPDPHVPDALLIAVGVLGVSTSGPLIAACAAPALAIAFWRNAIAAAVVSPWAFVSQRHARRQGEVRFLTSHAGVRSVVAGVLLALHFAAWMPSLTMTSVASSTAFVCMQAVWTAVLARLAGERLSRSGWAGIGLALAGVVVLSGVDLSLSTRALQGDLLALAGGLFSAGYVVLGARVRRTASTSSYTATCYTTCAVVLLAVCLVGSQDLVGFSLGDWVRILALTVAAQLLGHSVFNRVLRTVSPTIVSTAVLLEVPGAALLAAVFLDQRPPLVAVPALVLLMAGLALVVRARDAPGAPEPEPAAVAVA